MSIEFLIAQCTYNTSFHDYSRQFIPLLLREQDLNVGNSYITTKLFMAEVRRHQNMISGFSSYRNSVLIVAFNWKGMTSY